MRTNKLQKITHKTEWWCHSSQDNHKNRAHPGQDWFSFGRLAILLILGLDDDERGRKTITSFAHDGKLRSELEKSLLPLLNDVWVRSENLLDPLEESLPISQILDLLEESFDDDSDLSRLDNLARSMEGMNI